MSDQEKSTPAPHPRIDPAQWKEHEGFRDLEALEARRQRVVDREPRSPKGDRVCPRGGHRGSPFRVQGLERSDAGGAPGRQAAGDHRDGEQHQRRLGEACKVASFHLEEEVRQQQRESERGEQT